jgi:hypothetical protein
LYRLLKSVNSAANDKDYFSPGRLVELIDLTAAL